MLRKIKHSVVLFGLVWFSVSANAGLIGVKEIKVTTAYSGSDNYLQVSEVVATESGTGNDLALASAGATASGSEWKNKWTTLDSPDKAIDGVMPAGHPNLFHPDLPGPGHWASY